MVITYDVFTAFQAGFARNRHGRELSFDPAISSISTAIMITFRTPLLRGAGYPIRYLGDLAAIIAMSGSPACQPRFPRTGGKDSSGMEASGRRVGLSPVLAQHR